MNQMLSCGLLLSLCITPTLLYSQNLNATAELNLGIAAYDGAKYSDAIDHLERAVALDPNAVSGHLYLAKAYDNAYGEECDWDCDANELRRMRAIEEFNKVLELDPSNTEALKTLAWRYHRSAKSEEAVPYYRRALEADPNDFEALYTLAVIQWQRSYQLRQQKRAELKIGRNKSLIDSPSCTEIRIENLAPVEEGMALLQRANDLVKSNDVETYLSLLYQERADIQCKDQSAHDEDVRTSVAWADRACKTRRNPKRMVINCIGTSSRCPPPAPPPSEPGHKGNCPN
jgi:tetratricopeptide (TPR) repeat protein